MKKVYVIETAEDLLHLCGVQHYDANDKREHPPQFTGTVTFTASGGITFSDSNFIAASSLTANVFLEQLGKALGFGGMSIDPPLFSTGGSIQ